MQPEPIEPTPEMLAFYERRTNEHIERVRKMLDVVAEGTEYGEALIGTGEGARRFQVRDEERIPYVWLTEYHRCRRSGEPFEYPEGVAEGVTTERFATTSRRTDTTRSFMPTRMTCPTLT